MTVIICVCKKRTPSLCCLVITHLSISAVSINHSTYLLAAKKSWYFKACFVYSVEIQYSWLHSEKFLLSDFNVDHINTHSWCWRELIRFRNDGKIVVLNKALQPIHKKIRWLKNSWLIKIECIEVPRKINWCEDKKVFILYMYEYLQYSRTTF